ncbi:hypothetical protein AWM75_04335 [Aerococcus urinaehominis]|uniref:Uncharacterized protein n=1 Tax=Aerococcus urinaehominis TaxID=128944 RepID=A0A0X8FL26_9LACT|nr:hypothetical protein [Aerococcus urinaehominis]AMB99275.1 hypothetical protein AWM75_04335 [Aerococcus urinaehominis]SDM47476.1 hypothetical protein SAMN04487985_11835 [Aerococcus urinaehominis]
MKILHETSINEGLLLQIKGGGKRTDIAAGILHGAAAGFKVCPAGYKTACAVAIGAAGAAYSAWGN